MDRPQAKAQDPDTPPRPARRVAPAALLLGAAALMAVLLVFDLYDLLPPELLAPFATFGPPASVVLVVIVLAEGLAAALLLSTGRHPLDAPFVTHYGTRTLAGGGVLTACGLAAFLVWMYGVRLFVADSQIMMEASLIAVLCGVALLLSGLAVLASALVSPWVARDRA